MTANYLSESRVKGTPLHLSDYLQYLNDNPDITIVKNFKCGASRGQRPKLHASLPAGECFLYPDFLIFLTKAQTGAGWRTCLTNAIDSSALDIAMFKWAVNPKSILGDIAKSLNAFLSPQELDSLLTNPNSIFLPLQEVIGVETGCDLIQGNYIIIHTQDGDIVLAEHICDAPNPFKDLMDGKNPLGSMNPVKNIEYGVGKIKGYISASWHPDVVAALSAKLPKQPSSLAGGACQSSIAQTSDVSSRVMFLVALGVGILALAAGL